MQGGTPFFTVSRRPPCPPSPYPVYPPPTSPRIQRHGNGPMSCFDGLRHRGDIYTLHGFPDGETGVVVIKSSQFYNI